jgi:hypothetical protein
MYQFLEKKGGKARAYDFAKRTIQLTSHFMMNDFYQADELAKFADPFMAFWEYHKAMFRNNPNYPNECIEEKDRKIMIVHKCRNCEIAQMTIPELSPIGCDHDIAGYKTIKKN